ncbi:MAG: hypothetical protein KDK66_05550 [Deltaproteobacteria bacterium]|nr:hypothetical protein [Deltaproteobacteria bacterium]
MSDTATLEEYFVSEDCIACDACCDEFPDIFKMNEDHTRAKAVSKAPQGKFNPWEIVTVCPVDAISLVNLPMPPKPEGMEDKKEEAAPAPGNNLNWEERWLKVAGQPEDQWERMKRYGMASSFSDDGDHYTLRFDMPSKVPNHKLKFKWGLPENMPPYSYEINQVNDKTIRVKAKIEDENIKRLTGWMNSFPSMFLKEVQLDHPIKDHKANYDEESHILTVTLNKA